MKETSLQNQFEVQQSLWGKTCGGSGLTKRIEQAKKGWIPQGVTLEELSPDGKRFSRVFGEFAPKVLLASNPNGRNTLIPEQIAVAGGWCALRTKDVAGLGNDGVIMNPSIGALEPVTSVEQVARWIQGSVAFDQIVESVGAVHAGEYVAISERRLWTSRVVVKLSGILGRDLTVTERNQVESAVESAENKRFQMTGKYLEYVTGRPAQSLRRAVDDDIWDGLQKSRDEMFAKAGLSLARFQDRYPNERETLPQTSLVWSMYSEPYFDVLRQEGYLKSQKVFVVEPSLHAASESLADNDIAARVYQTRGVYHDPRGLNPNTGFVAYLECVTGNGKNTRREQFVGDVPNISNWQTLFDEGGTLSLGKNQTVTTSQNQVFLWGTNLLPFGQVKRSLLTLVSLQEEFKSEKAKLQEEARVFGSNFKAGRLAVQSRIDALRDEMMEAVQKQNAIISQELKGFFGYITGGEQEQA